MCTKCREIWHKVPSQCYSLWMGMTATIGTGIWPWLILLLYKNRHMGVLEACWAERLAAVRSDAQNTKRSESWVHSVSEGSRGKWCNHLSPAHTHTHTLKRLKMWNQFHWDYVEMETNRGKQNPVGPMRKQQKIQPLATKHKKQQCSIMRKTTLSPQTEEDKTADSLNGWKQNICLLVLTAISAMTNEQGKLSKCHYKWEQPSFFRNKHGKKSNMSTVNAHSPNSFKVAVFL